MVDVMVVLLATTCALLSRPLPSGASELDLLVLGAVVGLCVEVWNGERKRGQQGVDEVKDETCHA